MKKEPNILWLAVALVAGWFCLAYSSVCLKEEAPAKPTEWDQQVYEAAKQVIADMPNVQDGMLTPEERYEQDQRKHNRTRLFLFSLAAISIAVLFRSGFMLNESVGGNGLFGGLLAVFFGPFCLALCIKSKRKEPDRTRKCRVFSPSREKLSFRFSV
ncbi:MAG: hypothetical protein ACOCZS_03790 [Verrucomicrobiota bacterium]